MADRSLVFSPAPYHILSYGTLLGTQFFHVSHSPWISSRGLIKPSFPAPAPALPFTFPLPKHRRQQLTQSPPTNQTFINSIAAFKVLERPQFAVLQRALFPAYFGIQTAAPALLALTYPGTSTLGALNRGTIPTGISGVLHASNRWGVLAPLATVFATGLVNLVYLLPETNKVTAARRKQGKKDGKQSWDAAPHSNEMEALNKKFGQLHGISSLLNMATFAATIVYGFTLASRIE
ncbi:Uu.00g059000.m01.CDS01 [Anthostomella pinea]|uniref:Uu.00g059000.m01.CDS01 n=1 Tax=Anthostomella pinea TaxID=933095 RepID=A0AAI8VLE4_9PEZI|nr:Uu.00g059000.m01.CDS01 [Anthostomella pinea]